jgi:hypothetical protein
MKFGDLVKWNHKPMKEQRECIPSASSIASFIPADFVCCCKRWAHLICFVDVSSELLVGLLFALNLLVGVIGWLAILICAANVKPKSPKPVAPPTSAPDFITKKAEEEHC